MVWTSLQLGLQSTVPKSSLVPMQQELIGLRLDNEQEPKPLYTGVCPEATLERSELVRSREVLAGFIEREVQSRCEGYLS